MRTTRTFLAAAALALLVAGSAQALPPRMHSERGVVKAINAKTQTITLQICCDEEEFAWRDWTRVRIDGEKLAPEKITPGTPVRVSYRHETGKQALYEVRSAKEVNHCSGCAEQGRSDRWEAGNPASDPNNSCLVNGKKCKAWRCGSCHFVRDERQNADRRGQLTERK